MIRHPADFTVFQFEKSTHPQVIGLPGGFGKNGCQPRPNGNACRPAFSIASLADSVAPRAERSSANVCSTRNGQGHDAAREDEATAAEGELSRHFRTGRPVSLLILDVDRFKSINDRFGHPVGEAILRGVATVLRECCRATDTPARYGGDEFMLILPETDLAGAEEVAARIRRHLERMSFKQAPGLACTVSLGAAEANREIANIDAWIQRADAALYRAKDGGRDRFEGAVALDSKRGVTRAAGA